MAVKAFATQLRIIPQHTETSGTVQLDGVRIRCQAAFAEVAASVPQPIFYTAEITTALLPITALLSIADINGAIGDAVVAALNATQPGKVGLLAKADVIIL